jgi:NAD(P)-dependent dehydrogenase (short-subunit alcohol dehydrogenase family)
MTTNEEKVAVVTGAAGGLGRSIAAGLAGRGCRVVIADIDAKNGRATAAALTAAGGKAGYLPVDLSTPTGPETMIAETMAAYGRIDILVNNAGYGRGEGFAEMTAETWDRSYAINLRAVALAMRAAGAAMKAAGGGRIVNITSPASRMALPNYTAYSATKAALDSVTRAAAVALAPFGVRVNSVAPGMMDTPMQRDTEIAFAKLEGRGDIEKFLAERTARIPLGRRTDCDEVAAGAIWLALDAPDYIVAERLNLSGGLDRD